MSTMPLLATKLYPPPVRDRAVQRPDLSGRLEKGVQGRVTLLSAPPGFGKSSLVAEWAMRTRTPVGWLSLDEDDADPLRFLAYLAEALKRVDPSLGQRAARSLSSPQPHSADQVAAELINDLAAGAGDLAIVLDDYHSVDRGPLRELVAFLIEHAPPRLHLVMTTRSEPDLPLARWRARGEVTEFRSADLRFTVEEAAGFLTGTMGVTLTPEDVGTLVGRTEGWVAGLQLAALYLRDLDDPAEVARSFSGDFRHVVDYLAQEVLQRLPASVASFLLATSVLERLCGSLCDAVTGCDDGSATLVQLERANLFLVPLDHEGRWFRYHALFADVLRAQAKNLLDGGSAEYHARASVWFEAHGEVGNSIRHARLAGDVDRAARLLEVAWRSMDRNFQISSWYAWARGFPEEVLRERPVLAVAMAWARLGEGDMEGAGRWLSEAEQWLERHAGAGGAVAPASMRRFVADEVAFRSMPARIAAAHAYRAQAIGNLAAGEEHARRAVALAPDDDPGVRALPAGLLGLAHWARGELDEALAAMTLGMEGFRALGHAVAALSFTFAIAEMQAVQGRLRDSLHTYQQALRYAEAQDHPSLPGTAELHAGIAEVLLERGEVLLAEEHLRSAAALGDEAILPGDAGRLLAVRARVEAALGNADEAHALLDRAELLYRPGPVPLTRPIDATRARLWIMQGRLPEACVWADRQRFGPDHEPSYLDEYALLTVVRIRLAQFRADGSDAPIQTAVGLLDRILMVARAGGRTGTVVEALVALALVQQASGDEDAAVQALHTALRLTEPEGHQAVFVAEGPAMVRLLRAAGRLGAPKVQVRRLLAALQGPGAAPRVLPDLVEALSDRERDVLRVLRSDLTGPQAARELGMSVHTFRSHTKSIYAKLGVHGRREAILRAGQLELA